MLIQPLQAGAITCSHFMKKFMLLLFLSGIISMACYAQKPLTNSRQSSYYTYIYKLRPEDVLNFYLHPDKEFDEHLLHHPIDSFKTDKDWHNNLPEGNYLKVFVSENKLVYRLIENHSALLKLMPNGHDLRFIFLDKQGHSISNAAVMVNFKHVTFNSSSGVYQKNYSKKDTLIQAIYGGVVNIFSIKQHNNYYNHRTLLKSLSSIWYRLKNKFKKQNKYRYRPPSDPRYTGFMVFNKPRYKPHDTVKFKAFIVNKKSRFPISVPQLLVRLKENEKEDIKILGKVNNYRDGAYEYSFVLTDSLALSLDEKYMITLESLASAKYDLDKYDGDDDDKFLAQRKVYLTGEFQFEEYDLKSTRFNLRADKTEHRIGDALAVYLKATDENDLPVPDGRIKLTLTTRQVHQYKNKKVFVPDTLWVHQMPLDPIGETKLIIPDSIFPKANVSYEIDADFLNSANEHQSKSIDESFLSDSYHLAASINGDTLKATCQENGKELRTPATIYALNTAGDTVSQVKVTLPYKMIINPAMASYTVATDSTAADVEIANNESGISLSGSCTADSSFLSVNNPNKLHFWYSVFDESVLVAAGQADSLTYKRAYNGRDNITFKVNYIWGGVSKTEQKVVNFAAKLLNINVKQPLSVYPGQVVKTDIVVTDAAGKVVPNTDITAWSITRKFPDYNIPNIPYLGKRHGGKAAKKPFNLIERTNKGALALNWNRWGHELGLDSIVFYQFTHPESIFRIEEPTNDTVTQVAPFAVEGGDILPVSILYIDGRPVYFNQAEQLQRYSFRVRPGKHNFKFRTAHQIISIDSVSVEKSQKLIFSYNADAALKGIGVTQSAPDTLTNYEVSLMSNYMINVENNFDGKLTYLQQDDNISLLWPNSKNRRHGNSILTGPLVSNYAQFNHTDSPSQYFLADPGYSYFFGPGLLKQTSIPTGYSFNKKLFTDPDATNFKQYALTKNETDSIWQQYLDLRASTQLLFSNEGVYERVAGRLNISLSEGKQLKPPFVKNIIIYKYNDPDYIRIYPGITFDFGTLESGKYRLLFLLKGDRYDIIDSILVKPFGTNFYNLHVKPTHARDSVSIKINSIINNRNMAFKLSDSEIKNDALQLKEAFNDKYFDVSSFESAISGRIIGKDDKLPIIGCSVVVKGTRKGVVTDVNGRFRLNVPSSGKLVISFIGYQTKEIAIEPSRSVEIKLEQSYKSLNEVVVVGYGTVMKKDLSGSVQTITNTNSPFDFTNGLTAKAPGLVITRESVGGATTIRIRGNSSINSGSPLVIIDGVAVENMNDIDQNSIGEISVLKDAAATALYGSKAANGVIIIATKKKNNTSQTNAQGQQSDSLSIRKNFSDYAYWQPKLTTDEYGKASFTTTFPDDITNWRTFVIGINGNRQSGYAEHQIKSFKPLSAAFISPLFAVAGDEISAIGKVTNYNTDAAKLTRSFTYNGKLNKQDALEVKNTKIDTLNVTATNTDSLIFEYSIKRGNDYFDGEKRKIPVFAQGVQETKGDFEVLNADTSITMQFDPRLGTVTLHAEASALPVLMEEAQRLREYKYLCNEQLASKLKGLLAEKRIRRYLGEPFKYERNITDLIKKIQDNRRSQGTWGWWKDSDEELWISLHAIEALTDAQTEGYKIDLDNAKLTSYLVYQLESYTSGDKLSCLQLLHRLNAKIDYAKYADLIGKNFAKDKLVSKYDCFRLLLARQQSGLTVKLDSLLDTEHHTLFGNIYWGDDNYRFFDNSIQLSILAYQIIKNEGKHPELLPKIRGYFFDQRRTGQWRNTYETALILENILPDLLTGGKEIKPSTLVIKGTKTDTITKFPYSATLTGQTVKLSKTGTLPVYITAYQQFWFSFN